MGYKNGDNPNIEYVAIDFAILEEFKKPNSSIPHYLIPKTKNLDEVFLQIFQPMFNSDPTFKDIINVIVQRLRSNYNICYVIAGIKNFLQQKSIKFISNLLSVVYLNPSIMSHEYSNSIINYLTQRIILLNPTAEIVNRNFLYIKFSDERTDDQYHEFRVLSSPLFILFYLNCYDDNFMNKVVLIKLWMSGVDLSRTDCFNQNIFDIISSNNPDDSIPDQEVGFFTLYTKFSPHDVNFMFSEYQLQIINTNQNLFRNPKYREVLEFSFFTIVEYYLFIQKVEKLKQCNNLIDDTNMLIHKTEFMNNVFDKFRNSTIFKNRSYNINAIEIFKFFISDYLYIIEKELPVEYFKVFRDSLANDLNAIIVNYSCASQSVMGLSR